MSNQLQIGDKVYQRTNKGLITAIITIIRVTDVFAFSNICKFRRAHDSMGVQVAGKDRYSFLSCDAETPALKKQWQKQILYKDIKMLLSVDVSFEKLEAIYGILKNKDNER